MGFFDKLLGRKDESPMKPGDIRPHPPRPESPPARAGAPAAGAAPRTATTPTPQPPPPGGMPDRAATGLTGARQDPPAVAPGIAGQRPAPARAQVYTVQAGDSLSKIAQHFYGDAGKWHQIWDANRAAIDDPDRIYPGQKLTIPVPAG